MKKKKIDGFWINIFLKYIPNKVHWNSFLRNIITEVFNFVSKRTLSGGATQLVGSFSERLELWVANLPCLFHRRLKWVLPLISIHFYGAGWWEGKCWSLILPLTLNVLQIRHFKATVTISDAQALDLLLSFFRCSSLVRKYLDANQQIVQKPLCLY